MKNNKYLVLLGIIFSNILFAQDLQMIKKYQDSIQSYYKDFKVGYDQVLENGYSNFMIFKNNYKITFDNSRVSISYDDNTLEKPAKYFASFDLKKVDSISSGGVSEVAIANDESILTSEVLVFF